MGCGGGVEVVTLFCMLVSTEAATLLSEPTSLLPESEKIIPSIPP
jgi:hypothetical protein